MDIEYNLIEQAYKNFVIKQKHPCVMANTIFLMNDYHLKIYDDMSSENIIEPMLADIEAYLKSYDFESKTFETLIFCFKDNNFKTELQFEKALWRLLQKLHNKDDKKWDPTVSFDKNDANFSFSLKGRAFYMIGMHPKSSRMARRAPYASVVFNLHYQFEMLREMGIYQNVKKRIRRRDKKLQGNINPVLRDFGKDTEAKQYSGRAVEPQWSCPFRKKN